MDGFNADFTMTTRMKTFLFVCAITEALSEIRPGAEWNLSGNSYDGITWLDNNQKKPTKKEVSDGIKACNDKLAAQRSAKEEAKTILRDPTKTDRERLEAVIKVIDIQ